MNRKAALPRKPTLYPSPLRYPGGKTVMSGLLSDIILLNNLESGFYAEPYCGGAGAGLSLLFDGMVGELHLNDADPAVYSFWDAVTSRNSDFVARLQSVELSVKGWERQREIYREGTIGFDLGFAFFFLNRSSRSGIVKNSGPIGGFEQQGNFKIDARFNRDSLAERILRIGRVAPRITAYHMDGVDFIAEIDRLHTAGNQGMMFVDPPYYEKGASLYMNHFSDDDHVRLSHALRSTNVPWVLTYDNAERIRELYGDVYHAVYSIHYSAAAVRNETEFIAAREGIIVPEQARIGRSQLSRKEWAPA